MWLYFTVCPRNKFGSRSFLCSVWFFLHGALTMCNAGLSGTVSCPSQPSSAVGSDREVCSGQGHREARVPRSAGDALGGRTRETLPCSVAVRARTRGEGSQGRGPRTQRQAGREERGPPGLSTRSAQGSAE